MWRSVGGSECWWTGCYPRRQDSSSGGKHSRGREKWGTQPRDCGAIKLCGAAQRSWKNSPWRAALCMYVYVLYVPLWQDIDRIEDMARPLQEISRKAEGRMKKGPRRTARRASASICGFLLSFHSHRGSRRLDLVAAVATAVMFGPELTAAGPCPLLFRMPR